MGTRRTLRLPPPKCPTSLKAIYFVAALFSAHAIFSALIA